MNQLAPISALFDERGLMVELTEEQETQAAAAIGAVKGLTDLFGGDVINNRTKRLGIAPLTVQQVYDNKSNLDLILPLVKSMGYSTLLLAAKHAAVARAWPIEDRSSGLTYQHYEYVQGCDGGEGKLTREQARLILKEAQDGHRKKDGTWVKPHPASWVKKRRAALEGKPKAAIAIEADKQKHEVTSAIVPEVEKAIKATGVTGRKAQALTKKVEKEITKATKALQDEFTSAVDEVVQKKVAMAKKSLAKERSQWAQEKRRYTELRESLAVPISEHEYKILVQFCHPDKHPGNEEKAGKAYRIVEAIGERLQVAKRRKAGNG